jgi:FKBP-type peptidyl-prolyl cis-trans isomerase
MRHLPAALLLAATLTAAGCAAAPAGAPAPPEIDFAPSLAVNLAAMERTPGGVYLRDLREGEGQPARTGQRVRVYYVTWLPDGTQVEGLAPPAAPLEFELGAREVIRGWDEAVVGMRRGGQRQLVVPPRLAYGSRAVGGIPRNSTLVFIVELAEVR